LFSAAVAVAASAPAVCGHHHMASTSAKDSTCCSCDPIDLAAVLACALIAQTYLQACAGLSYSFSVYAPTIKDTLGLTQTQIATVGSAVNLGGYFAIISGSVYDNLKEHHRLGPRWVGLQQQVACNTHGGLTCMFASTPCQQQPC
jgi:hypothetical protein